MGEIIVWEFFDLLEKYGFKVFLVNVFELFDLKLYFCLCGVLFILLIMIVVIFDVFIVL